MSEMDEKIEQKPESLSSIESIISIPNANDYQNQILPPNFNYFNVNITMVLAVLMITFGVIIAYLI